MIGKGTSLAESVAENILTMITVDKSFSIGDKLPNENDLSTILNVSRSTLREAIRILIAHNVLEIKRGKGTYVKNNKDLNEGFSLNELSTLQLDIKDLYEMRLIFEPKSVYYAAKRATDTELRHILEKGNLVEQLIIENKDRTEAELDFHKSIAKSTHNEFMNKLIPILYKSIDKGVPLSNTNKEMIQDTLHDHRMILRFLKERDAEGAETAMKLHIIHAMRGFGIKED